MVSQPKAPDPYQQASAQQSANVGGAAASAIINNANERNPYGSVTYNQIGTGTVTDAQGKPMSVPRYERVVELSPEQKKLYGLQSQMQENLGNLGVSQSSRLQGLLGQEMNTSGLEPWSKPTAAPRQASWNPDAYSADRAKVETALMDRYRAQTNPQREAQEASLAARGLSPGGQAWGAVQDAQNRQDTDQMSAAILAGGQEQSRLLGEERQGYQQGMDYNSFLNSLRQGQFQETAALRNQPINEISSLMSGSQVSVPSFQPFSRQGVDSAPVGQYISQNYATKANAAANTNAGIFGLGNAFIGALPFF